MEDEVIPHTHEGIALAAYKMSMENNAMLKMVLMNQIAILRKLDIEPDPAMILDPMIAEFYAPGKDPVAVELLEVYRALQRPLEQLAGKSAWAFAVENDEGFDIDMMNGHS